MNTKFQDVNNYLENKGYKLQRIVGMSRVFLNKKNGKIVTFPVENRKVPTSIFTRIKEIVDE